MTTMTTNPNPLIPALHDVSLPLPQLAPMTLHREDLVTAARSMAVLSHFFQTDKLGTAYIHHPFRVAARMKTAIGAATAYLHDVLEDTPFTAETLRSAGMPLQVVEAVIALSHEHGEPREKYMARIIANGALAVDVKLADLADNTDPRRREGIDEETLERLEAKYGKSKALLEAVPFPIGIW